MKKTQLSLSFTLMSFFFASVQAFEPAKTAEESVYEGVQAVLGVVRKYAGNAEASARNNYLDEVADVLEPYVGYPVIARRVMDVAYSNANREQKIRFLSAFKRSMVNIYAGGIYAFGGYRVDLMPSQDDKKDTLRNTRVYLRVIAPEGTEYEMVQSVYYSQSAESWKMQNAIFNGINLGVTFKTQFEQIFAESGGDLDNTIAEWERITEESYASTNFSGES